MEWIKIPNLPQQDTALVAVSCANMRVVQALHNQNIEMILVHPCRALPAPVSSHADMLLHHLEDCKVIIAKGERMLRYQLEQYGFEVMESSKSIKREYPYDVVLNAARVGNLLFCNSSALDEKLHHYYEAQKITIIPVQQGYAKCSTVIVNDTSIITADKSIIQAGEKAGLDVLKITPGYVKLDGYPYGFLGGASGMIGKQKLAFAGNISYHPDYKEIEKFCKDRNVEILSLTDMPLTDVGGILPLKTRTVLDI